ncbi:MAG: ABC transporter ATP-binding protein [Desulfobulbus propionicus]|nr:MAG: ABC transporter ATP-binding protein [Desulfobulbus propionicus]
MVILETVGLSHRFSDGTRALNKVSLSFSEGELTVITGANGSGKTTLLKHFNGLLFPETGTVTVCGEDVAKNTLLARKNVGMVFQDPDSQIVGETVYDDVAFGPENLALERAEIDRRVQRALCDVELSGFEEKNPHALSGGEKRRLAVAGVLAMHPKILVMDEPFSNLDFSGACKLLEQILRLHDEGRTIIITTHDLEKIIFHARRLVVMDRGEVAVDDIPEKVLPDIQQYGVRPPCSVLLGRGLQPWEL